jgi:hypothetical protein
MVDKSNPRNDRLRSALRENLKRRKEQVRERAQTRQDSPSESDQGRNSARIGDDQTARND